MRIGQLIKMERRRQNIKQEILARGICSPSHLSKIESGTTVAGDKVQQQLLKRLNISLKEDYVSPSFEESKRFHESFQKILNQRDKGSATLLYEEIQFFLEEHPLYKHKIDLLLIEIRLALMISKDLELIKSNISLLISFQSEMTAKQRFHLYIVEGIVAYMENRFTNALHIFTDIYKQRKEYALEDWEIADLHYVLSLAALSDYRYIATIDHVQEALSYYNAKMLAKRSIECLLVLGIAQKHSGSIEEALVTFKKAKEIMENSNTFELLGIIEQNLGACYSLLEDGERALHHFNKSLSLKTNPDNQLITILSIVREYMKTKDTEQAIIWLTKGTKLLHLLNIEEQSHYSHHCSIYKVLLENSDDFLHTFESALKYFENKQNYYYCFVYTNLLAEKLADSNKFKLATIFYKKAFDYHFKYRKVQHWEDLT